MKYRISINQQVLAETQLDLLDTAILDYIHFICTSRNPKIENSRRQDDVGIWTWVDYSHLMSSMPLLRIKTRSSVTPRIRKVEKEGFILTKKHGRRLYVLLEAKIDTLFVKTNDTVHLDERSSAVIVRPNEPIRNIDKEYNNKEEKKLTPAEEAILFFTNPSYQEEVIAWLKEKGCPDDIARRECIKFISYWTELNKSGKKQRWEMEKTFEIRRRIATWLSRAGSFKSRSKGREVIL